MNNLTEDSASQAEDLRRGNDPQSIYLFAFRPSYLAQRCGDRELPRKSGVLIGPRLVPSGPLHCRHSTAAEEYSEDDNR